MLDLRRRQFITLLLGGAVAWPLAARAQLPIPVIGFLTARGPGDVPRLMAAFHTGLKAAGFVEGQNVALEYRFAEGRNERLPALAADLVQRQVTVIAAVTTPAALAAQAATTTIPIVFETGTDPIQLGLVASLNQPGGNVTGITSMIVEVAPKRLELLHELLPTTTRMALLVNPADRALAQSQSREVLTAARSLGIELHVVNANSDRDFDAVFANLKRVRAGGLVIGPGSVTLRGIEQLAALTVRYAVPAIHQDRDFTAAGGLMSYGSDVADSYRLAGIYTGRILHGENAADLPVQQASRFNLYLNLKTAKALGLTVPDTLLARADEVMNDPPRVHHAARRRGGVAARGAGAAAHTNCQDRAPSVRLAISPNLVAAFRQGLRSLGYIEGRNLFIERRYAEGSEERLPQLARELVEYGRS